MTDKQKVTERFPKASCIHDGNQWVVIPVKGAKPLGSGKSPQEAWKAAATEIFGRAAEQTEPNT